MAGSELFAIVRAAIEWAALGIEVVAVAVIVAAVVKVIAAEGTYEYLFGPNATAANKTYKDQLGRPLLLALDLLVAANVVKTVALEPTLTNIAALGLLVLIRTFLSWTLILETEGRRPWEKRPEIADPGKANK